MSCIEVELYKLLLGVAPTPQTDISGKHVIIDSIVVCYNSLSGSWALSVERYTLEIKP